MKRIGKAKRHFYFIVSLIFLGLFVCILAFYQKAGNEEKLCINEVLFTSFWPVLGDEKHPTEWIEIYNGTEAAVNLKGYGLSDDPDEPLKWTFPDITVEAEDYVLVYTEKYTGEDLKTNFNLGKKREYVLLSDPMGDVLDTIYNENAFDDISVGRFPDGGEQAVLVRTSPGSTNNGTMVSKYIKNINDKEEFGNLEFSKQGGYYDEKLSLELHAGEGETILYTLDGSEPTLTSREYRTPIVIKNRSGEENLYVGKGKTSIEESVFRQINDAPVTKGTVVRARLAQNGVLDSEIYTETYFVGIDETITSVSLVLDPEDLFGYEDGIYTRGNLYKWSMRTDSDNDRYRYLGNYSVKGENLERAGHVEFFSKDGSILLQQNVGVRMGGGLHRRRSAAKTLRLYASGKYDDTTEFTIPFWSASELGDKAVKQLVLRTDQKFAFNTISDVFVSTLYLGQDMGIQAYEPAVLYINGEFWDIMAVRERIEDEFIEKHFGIPAGDVTLIKVGKESPGEMELECGSEEACEEYENLCKFVTENDMSLPENYEYIKEHIDIASFIRNWWAHIFFSVCDWPDNNIRVFRSNNKEGSGFSDGKWRYILYDMDRACIDYTHNTLLYAMGEVLERGHGEHLEKLEKEWTELFSGFMKNAEFRTEFLRYYIENRETYFDPLNLKLYLDKIIQDYEPYFEKTEERWKRVRLSWIRALAKKLPDGILDIIKLDESWVDDISSEVEVMYEFIEKRRDYMDRFVEEYYESIGESIEIA